MTNLYFAKTTGRSGRAGFLPADEHAEAAVQRIGDGEIVQVKLVRPRSLHWHRMYFGICTTIGEMQDPARDQDSIDHELRVLAGHFDVIHARKGNELYEVRTPKRIAFDKLTAEQWEALWPSLELSIRERFGEQYLKGPSW